MLKKNQLIEGLIEDAVFPNKGLLYFEGDPVYISGTFKGQAVKARVIKKKNKVWEARLLETLQEPDYFTAPGCRHFGLCGGCSTQHLPYEKQLALKHDQVTKLLKAAEITEYKDLGILGSPERFEYRNKMEFSFGDAVKDGPMTLGMHKKNSTYDVISVHGCKLVDPDFSAILEYTLDYCVRNKLNYYRKMSHIGYMRYLVIRKSKGFGEILVNIVTSSQKDFSFEELAKELTKLNLNGKITGVLHTVTDTLADAIKPDEVRLIHGSDQITEKILGLKFKISPFSFFQTNSQGAEILYKNALALIENLNDKTVFDLYCGTGTITQIMATRARKVFGIEIIEEAVEKAKENTALNQITNCEFIAGDVLTEVDQLKENPDIIVLDPPRDGIHPKAIQKIINFNAKELLYISCKPTALARDLPLFKAAGYRIDKLICVDMFPQTVHVETVCLMSRKDK